jgi:hypothetical protein
MPTSHFPTAAVRYPALDSSCAIVVMLMGMPWYPPTGSSGLVDSGSTLTTLTWMGARPDCSEQRVGLHILCT